MFWCDHCYLPNESNQLLTSVESNSNRFFSILSQSTLFYPILGMERTTHEVFHWAPGLSKLNTMGITSIRFCFSFQKTCQGRLFRRIDILCIYDHFKNVCTCVLIGLFTLYIGWMKRTWLARHNKNTTETIMEPKIHTQKANHRKILKKTQGILQFLVQ